jgi:hypothetical protein
MRRVPHRLAMGADGAYRGSRTPAGIPSGHTTADFREKCGDCVCVRVRELITEHCGAMQFVVAAIVQGERFGAQRFIEWHVVTGKALDAVAIESCQNGVSAIETGAGHQPDVKRFGH